MLFYSPLFIRWIASSCCTCLHSILSLCPMITHIDWIDKCDLIFIVWCDVLQYFKYYEESVCPANSYLIHFFIYFVSMPSYGSVMDCTLSISLNKYLIYSEIHIWHKSNNIQSHYSIIRFDLTKVPDIYDMIRFDVLHNSHLEVSTYVRTYVWDYWFADSLHGIAFLLEGHLHGLAALVGSTV